jgi:transketolase
VQAADALAAKGVRVTLLSCPTVVPLDETTLFGVARATGCVVTVEEHGPGGLGALVGEALARGSLAVRFRPLRLQRAAASTAGTQVTMRAAMGLSVEGIVAAVEL